MLDSGNLQPIGVRNDHPETEAIRNPPVAIPVAPRPLPWLFIRRTAGSSMAPRCPGGRWGHLAPRRPVERFGREASAFTKRMVEGKKVLLEYDQDRRDRFGRTLAYAYLEDGTFLNAEIVKQGYGHAYTQFPFKYLEEFRGYEREAQEAQRGL